MSNVKQLPLYRPTDRVIMLDSYKDDDGIVVNSTVLQSEVVQRLFTVELGWIYQLEGIQGWITEGRLKPYHVEEVTTHISDPVGIMECIDPEVLREAFAECSFKSGDYATTLEELPSGELIKSYLLILGTVWENGEIGLDAAHLNDGGRFIDTGMWYYEDALEPISNQEMDVLVRQRRGMTERPRLSIVRSTG